MSSPSSCLRCSRPAALLSPLGLCPSCAATDGSAAPTPRGFSGATSSALTATADPAAATATAGTLAAPAALQQAPPGYELLERLGRGGMGSVYLARDSASERLVAMKFLHHPGDAEALERFLVELRVLALFDHPGIVRVLSSDFLRASPFFTMEYAPGGSLSRALDSGKPMPVAEAVRLVRAVAEAVAVAHAKGVIHRDLKPSNVLLTADGTVKVSDFGLAKRLDADDQLTRASGALGTTSYMPPEQVSRKNGEVGKWSDVYGLGATFYHLLTGRPPFRGDTNEETVLRLLSDLPERPRAIRPDIPMALEAVVLKCLEKDPKDRYAGVAEFLADLDRYEAGLKPDAPQLTRRRRLKRWAGRNRGAVATALAGAAVVLAAAAFLALKPSPAKTDDELAGDIRRELAAGRPVVLVDEKGRALYRRWALGKGEFATREGGFAVLSPSNALLELSPDPGIDRYRVSLEIRQLESAFQRTGGQPDAHGGGFYFGYDLQALDGGKVHTFAGVRVIHSSLDRRRLGQTKISYYDRFQVEPRLVPDGGGETEITGVHCDAVPKLPGPWRRFGVELTPDQIKLDFGPEFGDERYAVHDAVGIRARVAKLQQEVRASPRDKYVPGVELPPWSSRRPFGVRVHGATVAVRNVVITPLLPPAP